MMRRSILGLFFLLGACATDLPPEQVSGAGQPTLCDSVQRWRMTAGSMYDGGFPQRAFDELMRRNPNWKTKHRFDLNNVPRLGATSSEVRCLWPMPRDVNRTIVAGMPTREQWVYGGEYLGQYLGTTRTQYLYFDDGVLVAIQD